MNCSVRLGFIGEGIFGARRGGNGIISAWLKKYKQRGDEASDSTVACGEIFT